MHPARQAYVEEDGTEDADMGVDLAHVPLDREYEMPSATAGIAPERASAILSQFDRKRRAAQIAVPTDDGRVRARLREMEEPITLFGEGPGDRRDRLRELLTTLSEDAEAEGVSVDTPMGDDGGAQQQEEEEFYTEGSQELLLARREIARYSLSRARARIIKERAEAKIRLPAHQKHRKAIKERLQGVDLFGTQILGDRAASIARFSPNGEVIAAGAWGGRIRLLDVPTLDEKKTFRGATGIVGGISWFPGATMDGSNVSADSVNLASGSGGQGGKNEIHLWSLNQETPLVTLNGHSDRVCRVEFHPSGRYLASASFDTTWRLWDVETTTELLLQEGHSRQVFTVSFNTEGSLLASGGYDSFGLVWDLRQGRNVLRLDGHSREVHALDWGADGYRVLSGSSDGYMKCWDIRNPGKPINVPGHQGGVTDLRWFKGIDGMATFPLDTNLQNGGSHELVPKKAGTFVVSSGFDKDVKIYSADDWSLVKTLSGHSGNVLSVDVSQDSKWIVSSGYDRTVKLWGREDGEGV